MTKEELDYYVERFGEYPISMLPKIVELDSNFYYAESYDEQTHWYLELQRYLHDERPAKEHSGQSGS